MPERVETYSVWFSPEGVEHAHKPRPTFLVQDPRTGEMRNPNINEANWLAAGRYEQRTRTIPAKRYPDDILEPLTSAVQLPGVAAGDPSLWPAQE